MSRNGNSLAGREVTIAVVQPRLAVGEVERNLQRVADLTRLAHREHNAEIVLLPEAITSPNMYDPALRGVAQPLYGRPLQLLQQLARELGCAVGGGYMARRGTDTHGTYALVEADGRVHFHDKDTPSLWENAYYTGGQDTGLSTTSFGTVGLACGFEWARSRTARRSRGRAVAMLGGSCYWSYPDWPGVRKWFQRDHEYNMQTVREMPARMARAVGAPVAIAQQVGKLRSRSPLMPLVPYDTAALGESQIVERDGRVLARLQYSDGESYTAARVRFAPPEPLDPIVGGFWMSPQPVSIHAVWHLYNTAGRVEYRLRKAVRRHPWQSLPADPRETEAAADVVEPVRVST